ncbi:hypothetical protein TNCV_2524871 [Trichonephila clavipes]|nr:hypothetical protein TNCV_2524871 [Trichonephila clavipes]
MQKRTSKSYSLKIERRITEEERKLRYTKKDDLKLEPYLASGWWSSLIDTCAKNLSEDKHNIQTVSADEAGSPVT